MFWFVCRLLLEVGGGVDYVLFCEWVGVGGLNLFCVQVAAGGGGETKFLFLCAGCC